MRTLLCTIMFSISLFVLSQNDTSQSQSQLEYQMIKLRQDGWQRLTLGIMGHGISTFGFMGDNDWSNPGTRQNFFIANGFGLTLDVLAFTSFAKAHKIKKQMQTARPKY